MDRGAAEGGRWAVEAVQGEGARDPAANLRPMPGTQELDALAGADPAGAIAASRVTPLVLDRYRLGARLGAGGFGTVYAARDERLDREVAVKVIPADGQAPERARREAIAVARLDHPGIVALFDAGEDEGGRYLVSELVHGATLAELEERGELSDRDVLRAGLALADALAHAHGRGVVHRDIKPQNVLVPASPRSRRGAAKLTDFGVAHLVGDDPLTRTGDVVGTLAYMAPEQAEGRATDARTDLYALGLLLYEALTGFHPVAAGTPAATAKRLGKALPPLRKIRPDLPPELTAALDRAVRPKPEERGSLEELFDALAAALPAVSDAGGTIARHPLEGAIPALPPGVVRALPPAAAAVLTALALATLTERAPLHPLLAGLLAGVLVLGLPRLGWVLAALGVALALALGPDPSAGAAVLVFCAAVLVPLLLRGEGSAWSLPAAAPALGLLGLAGAFPALAGWAPRLPVRAALGALGAWWLVLAEPLLERVLVFGPAPGTPPRALWEDAAALTAADVLAPAVSSGALGLAVIWAVAAAVLPWIVRGRTLGTDFVLAALWATGVATATAALGEALGDRVAQLEPRGLAAGAFAAAVLATLVRDRGAGHHTLTA
jgi:hypothetical protein